MFTRYDTLLVSAVIESMFKGQGHRPINAHTVNAQYLLNGKAYELKTWYTDGGQRSVSP